MRVIKKIGASRHALALLVALALALPATAVMAVSEEQGKVTPFSFLSDGWISTRIETAYFLDGKLNTFDVDVEVRNGAVYVMGFVPTVAERDHALALAGRVSGVKSVEDKLIVDPDYKTKLAKGEFFELGPDDYWTSRKVKTGLLMSPRVTGTWIGVEADEGVVTLRGSVYKMNEKQIAEEIAAGISGVTKVDNKIICCRQ